MTWTITQKPAFLDDLIDLPKDLQKSVGQAIVDLTGDPVTPRGHTIKKLAGYDNVYRYRLGDFRLIYAAERQAQMVNLLSVGPRGRVYERFNYDGWNAPDAAVAFGPQLAARPEWQEHPEWRQPAGPAAGAARLPRVLTADLLARWRIDPAHHAVLLACRTEDDLLAANAHVPDAALDRVMKGLYSPTPDQLAAEPDLMLYDPADLLRYAEGDLAGFLLRLDDRQEPLTRWALRGPTLVKGGPGSGKSTVALYRVRAVVDHHLAQTGRLPSVLFTTYTNALINASESLLRQLLGDSVRLTKNGRLPPEIRVSTLSRTAQWIARSSGEPYEMAGDHHRAQALHAARAALTPRAFGQADLAAAYGQIRELRDDYLLEEFDWVIEGQTCRHAAAYLAADRAGRGIAFGRERRAAVWRLYETYRDHLAAQNLITWGELTLAALDRVRAGEFTRRWDYVIVDEAQDLPPAALALAVELCRDPGGVFLTADANQSLYNRGFRWRAVHTALAVSGRTRILRRNYRTARPIAAAAARSSPACPTPTPTPPSRNSFTPGRRRTSMPRAARPTNGVTSPTGSPTPPGSCGCRPARRPCWWPPARSAAPWPRRCATTACRRASCPAANSIWNRRGSR
ncbi:MAG: UvrD-helicase domain-containing protein [Chloroflexota bacterium]